MEGGGALLLYLHYSTRFLDMWAKAREKEKSSFLRHSHPKQCYWIRQEMYRAKGRTQCFNHHTLFLCVQHRVKFPYALYCQHFKYIGIFNHLLLFADNSWLNFLQYSRTSTNSGIKFRRHVIQLMTEVLEHGRKLSRGLSANSTSRGFSDGLKNISSIPVQHNCSCCKETSFFNDIIASGVGFVMSPSALIPLYICVL